MLAPWAAEGGEQAVEAADAVGVVGEVEEDLDAGDDGEVGPAGVVGDGGVEAAQAGDDGGVGDAEGAGEGGGGEGVGDVVGRGAAEAERELGDRDQGVAAIADAAGESAVAGDKPGLAAGDEVSGEGRVLFVVGEPGDRCREVVAAGDEVDQGLALGAEDHAAVRGDDAADDGLDAGHGGEVVDAVLAEVVGADVEDGGGVAAVDAEAAPEDAAAGDLEDGEVDLGVAQDGAGGGGAGPVAGPADVAAAKHRIGRDQDERAYVLIQQRDRLFLEPRQKRELDGWAPLPWMTVTISGGFEWSRSDGAIRHWCVPVLKPLELPLGDAPERCTFTLASGGRKSVMGLLKRPSWAIEWGQDATGLYALAPSPLGEPRRLYWDNPTSMRFDLHLVAGRGFSAETVPIAPGIKMWADLKYGLVLDVTLGNATQRFRWIEPGEFVMGSPEGEAERQGPWEGFGACLWR